MKSRITIVFLALAATAQAAPASGDTPIRGIMDNSFFVEEAYNQESGVVQHIFNAMHSVNRGGGPDEHAWDLAFTQEWPLFSQTHQISYTVPYSFVNGGGHSANDGVGDVLLNYRYQAWFQEETLTALAPRFSLILPTGDARRGFGDDTVGYQFNLPFSTALADRWAVNANAGLTFLPDAGTGPTRDLLNYNLGASVIYAATDRLHFLCEWIGGWEEFVADGGTDREFAAILSPGARFAFNWPNDTQLVIGAAVPIGLNRAAPDFGVFFYLSFEHRFLPKE